MKRRALFRYGVLTLPGLGSSILTACGGGGSDPQLPPTTPGATANAQLAFSTAAPDDPFVLTFREAVADSQNRILIRAEPMLPSRCVQGISNEPTQGIWLRYWNLNQSQWSSPTLLSTEPHIAKTPKLVAGDRGAMMLAYVQAPAPGKPSDTSMALVVHQYDPQADLWSEPRTLATFSTTGSLVQMLSDLQGNAMVIWLEGSGSQATAFSRRFDQARATWEAKRELPGFSLVGSNSQTAQIDANGRVTWFTGSTGLPKTIWENDPETDTWLFSELSPVPPEDAVKPLGTSTVISISASGSQKVVASIDSFLTTHEDQPIAFGPLVIARQNPLQMQWTRELIPPPAELNNGPAVTGGLQLSVDDRGNAWLWGNTKNLVYHWDSDARTWETVSLTPDILPGGAQYGGGQIRVSNNGDILAIYSESAEAGKHPGIWWNRYDASTRRWRGLQRFVVSAPEVEDPLYFSTGTSVSAGALLMPTDNQLFLMISQSVSDGGFRCYGNRASRTWLTSV